MNMKKILCLLLALTLLVALVSCGKSQGGENHTHVWVEATCTAAAMWTLAPLRTPTWPPPAPVGRI